MKKIEINYGSVCQSRKGRPVAFVSINGHTIKRNSRTGSKDAPIRIARSQSDKRPVYASEIDIVGPSQLLYSPGDPIMRCGARLVLVAAYDDVRVIK